MLRVPKFNKPKVALFGQDYRYLRGDEETLDDVHTGPPKNARQDARHAPPCCRRVDRVLMRRAHVRVSAL
jgi:hypothetical protein